MANNAREINRIQVVGYDFNTVLDDLRSNGVALFGILANDFQGDLGARLQEYYAYALDALMYYLDRRVTEGTTATARLRSSMSLLTRMLGYKMRAAVSSSTDVRVELTDGPYAFDVVVPQYFAFTASDGRQFLTSEEITYTPGETVLTLPVFEAEQLTERFVSDGSGFQKFRLRRVPASKFPVGGSVSTIVDGSLWEESEFLTYDATDQYEIDFNADPSLVRFGDGIVGNIPAESAEILVTYFACSGTAGNVGADTITSSVLPLVVNFTSIALSITNVDGSVGGDDPETLASARAFAGKVFKSRKVAVTGPDYAALAGSYADSVAGRVAVAKALSSKTSSTDLTLENALLAIEQLVQEPVPTTQTETAAAIAALDSVVLDLATILTALTDIATVNTQSIANLSTAVTNTRSVKTQSTAIEANANNVTSLALEGELYLDGLTPGDILTQTDIDTLRSYYARSSLEATQIVQTTTAQRAVLDGVIAIVQAASDDLGGVGTDLVTAGTTLESAETARAAALASIGDSDTPTGVYANLDAISAVVVDTSSEVFVQTSAIRVHMDSILSADCKANLVTVAILARDSGGFYAAPSQRLIRSLQSFLDARKEVTQAVSVTSGANFLMRAVISVRIGVEANVSERLVEAQVAASTDSVLRDRDFEASLYLDELYDPLRAIEGKRFVNVTILGYLDEFDQLQTDRLDTNGNLIILPTEVVTKGSVSITVEPPT